MPEENLSVLPLLKQEKKLKLWARDSGEFRFIRDYDIKAASGIAIGDEVIEELFVPFVQVGTENVKVVIAQHAPQVLYSGEWIPITSEMKRGALYDYLPRT